MTVPLCETGVACLLLQLKTAGGCSCAPGAWAEAQKYLLMSPFLVCDREAEPAEDGTSSVCTREREEDLAQGL